MGMMQESDVEALRTAVATLERPRLAARLAEIAGKPIELFNRALPEGCLKGNSGNNYPSAQFGPEDGAADSQRRAQGSFQLST